MQVRNRNAPINANAPMPLKNAPEHRPIAEFLAIDRDVAETLIRRKARDQRRDPTVRQTRDERDAAPGAASPMRAATGRSASILRVLGGSLRAIPPVCAAAPRIHNSESGVSSGRADSRTGDPDMAAVDDFTAGGYRFIPGGFQFSGGVAATQGFEIKRFRFRVAGAARRRLRAHREDDHGRRPPAHRVLRLRVALAGAIHRAGLPRLQRGLCGDAREVGRVRRQGQSGGAQQCVPRVRSAGRTELPCLLVHRADRGDGAELRDLRPRRGAGGRRQLPRAHRPVRRSSAEAMGRRRAS